jgi:hypothetical protein
MRSSLSFGTVTPCLVVALLLAPSPVISADAVLRGIGRRGAREELARVSRDDADWAAVTDGIAAGEAPWLEVADALLAVADDPEAYDLEAAVGEALAVAPGRVLERADSGGEIEVSWVCDETTTFEDDPDLEERIALLTEREEAVRRVKTAGLAAKRERCLRILAKARGGLEKELQSLTRKIG